MKIPFLHRSRRDETIGALYGAIVAQARRPVFYRALGVPDTLEGRFEMLVLHLALVLDRLEAEAAERETGQGIFDRFCQDMDDHMREMGVGDLTVPKKMRRLADAFYGRRAAYGAAQGHAGALEAALRRNVFDGAPGGDARALSRYVGDAEAILARQDAGAIAAGQLVWPEAETISGEGAGAPEDGHR